MIKSPSMAIRINPLIGVAKNQKWIQRAETDKGIVNTNVYTGLLALVDLSPNLLKK